MTKSLPHLHSNSNKIVWLAALSCDWIIFCLLVHSTALLSKVNKDPAHKTNLNFLKGQLIFEKDFEIQFTPLLYFSQNSFFHIRWSIISRQTIWRPSIIFSSNIGLKCSTLRHHRIGRSNFIIFGCRNILSVFSDQLRLQGFDPFDPSIGWHHSSRIRVLHPGLPSFCYLHECCENLAIIGFFSLYFFLFTKELEKCVKIWNAKMLLPKILFFPFFFEKTHLWMHKIFGNAYMMHVWFYLFIEKIHLWMKFLEMLIWIHEILEKCIRDFENAYIDVDYIEVYFFILYWIFYFIFKFLEW